jgi:hypothetical protein
MQFVRGGSALSATTTTPAMVALLLPASSSGILNASAFGVDGSGTTDVTHELQAAISAAYEAQLALWLPAGARYLVSDTLWANQSNFGSSLPVNLRPARWRTNVILGSPKHRPTIVLAAHSPGFSDAAHPKNVLKLHNTGRENDHMNQLLRSVDFELRAGNPGAVAVFVHGAQGTSVQDVTVHMVDALAGFGGGGGAGASHLNISAIGGQYGVRFDESEPGPVVAGGRFYNQSVSGVSWLVGKHNSNGQGPLVVVGVTVQQAVGASGPAISSTGTVMYVIDAVIQCSSPPRGGSFGVAVSPNAYLRGVYTKSCMLTPGKKPGPGDRFSVIHEAVHGTIWAEGRSIPHASIMNTSTLPASEAPPDVVAMHIPENWDQSAFLDTDFADAVVDCHAKGDGVSDDTHALQACLDKHSKVFLPKGLFRINKTLQMSADSTLIGLSQTHSVIAPVTTGFRSSLPAPLLRTAMGKQVNIAFVGLVTWWHVPGVFTLEWHAKQGVYRSNYESRVCECMWLSDYGSPNSAHGKLGTWPPSNCSYPAVNLSVAKTQIYGTGKFFNYVSDEDILMTDHINYRDLLVSNNSASVDDRLAFYAINLEHAMSQANGELRAASHVDIFGLKKEGSTTVLWIRDSRDITVVGTAGGYTALSNKSQYPNDFAPYVPSIYRVERTSPLKLAITAYDRDAQNGYSAADRNAFADQTLTMKVKCSFPLDASQLQAGHFPHHSWPALISSLWAPWCGYNDPQGRVLVEADGPSRVLVATKDAGMLYLRGYPTPPSIG